MADLQLQTEAGAIDISLPTATDLSAKQYYAVKLDSSEEVVLATLNSKNIGILQNKPNGSSTKDVAVVRVGGVSLAKISETVVTGKFLTSDASGTLEVCDAAGEEYVARSIAGGEANDLISVVVCFGEVEATDA